MIMKRYLLILLISTAFLIPSLGRGAAARVVAGKGLVESELAKPLPAGARFRHTPPQGGNWIADTSYFQTRSGLNHFYRAVTKQKKATVAFLGGSITFNPGWRQKVCAYLQAQYPETQFHFIAAGIPSLGSLPHAFRLQRDILDSGKVDLLFFEAAVNDKANRTDSTTQYRGLEGVVRHAKKSNRDMDIIMMSFADPYKNNDYANGSIPAEVYRHELIASYYSLPSINLAKEVADKVQHKVFSWENDFKDLHPSPFGQELYYRRIKKLLETTYSDYVANAAVKKTALPKPLHNGLLDNGMYVDVNAAQHDTGWTYNPNWTPENKQGTRDGFVDVPMLTTQSPGNTLTFNFKGNAVGIAIVSGADAGMISYKVDQGPEQKLDLFTEWSGSLHLPWYLLLGADLSNGKHTLTITMLADKNQQSKGNACRIVHFLVNKE